MRYFGGKNRIADQIASVIFERGHQEVMEPFCGGLSVTVALRKRGIVVRPSDGNSALISLYQSVLSGWEPPVVITDDDYAAAKILPNCNPLLAFIGIGCSFSGKWFGGMARSGDGRNYALNAARSLKRKIADLTDVTFEALEFQDIEARAGAAIYCDPPYAGTTGYSGLPKWNPEYFWETANEWARITNVYVSEYSAPRGWKEIWRKQVVMDTKTRNGKEVRTEKLFHRGPCSAQEGAL